MHIRKSASLLALVAFGGIAIVGATPANALSYVSTVVASELNNPRGIAFGWDGALYIAEGGTLNPGGLSIANPEGSGLLEFGESGSITRVLNGVQARFITDLPSLTATPSGSASGPQDIAFYNGLGYVVIGLGADPAVRAAALGGGAAANLATLYSFTSTGQLTHVADLGTYETDNNPTGDQKDSNPYHLTAGSDGLLVTDAGGNDLLHVTAEGMITTLAVFPAIKGVDAVPTGVSVGPDGAFYVGQLTGVPFTPDAANIFRIKEGGGAPDIYATDFTNITDIAWGADGSLYVLQYADEGIFSGGTGSIIRIAPDEEKTRSTVFAGLVGPTGLAIGPDGALYVTNHSASAGIGEVLRIAAVPEPATWALLIAGFAMTGAALRRRKASVTLHYG